MNNIDQIKPRKWLQIILIIIALAIVVVLANKIITDRKGKERKSIFNIIDVSSINKDSFNSDFEHMSGSQSGFFLINDLDTIITNNKKNKDHLVTVKYGDTKTNNPDEIRELKKEIEDGDEFEVSVDYDKEGFVNLITIELTKKDKSKITSFNRQFETWIGTHQGSVVGWVLDDAIKNNNTEEHKVTIVYGDVTVSDVERIKELKQSFSRLKDYEVSVNYDADGYIDKIIIENR